MTVLRLELKLLDGLRLNFCSVLGSMFRNWDWPGGAGWKEVLSQ